MKIAKKIPKTQAFRNETKIDSFISNVEEKAKESKDNSNNEVQNIDEDQKILEAFRAFDLNGDGKMSCFEFTSMLSTCAPDLTSKDIEEIIKESNLDAKGFMNYEEFIQFWKKMSTE